MSAERNLGPRRGSRLLRAARTLALAIASLGLAAGSCVATGETEKQDDGALRDDFEPVSEMLGARCGSLDCHGDAARSLRLYHHYGLRLGKHDVPGGDDTTGDEHDANFLSVVGLEPEETSAVAKSGGDGYEQLTIYRKALGLERHKGHRPMTAKDDAARCLVSWLKGSVDIDLCEKASAFQRPVDP